MAQDAQDLQDAAETKIELTEREIAIIEGRDPDVVEAGAKEAVKDDKSAELAADSSEGGSVAGKDAGPDTNGGKDAASPSWFSEDDKSLGESYGLTEDDLRGFASRDEFRKAARLLDKQFAKAAKQPPEAAAEKSAEKPGEKAGEKPADTKAKPTEGKTADEELNLDPEEYEKAGYDNETVKLVKARKADFERIKALEARLARQEQIFQEQEAARSMAHFHQMVDGLDADRYGRAVDEQGRFSKLEQAHDENRRKLFEASDTIIAGIVARARERGEEPVFPTHKALLQRAELLAFGDDIRQQERAKQQKEIAEQSKRRRPAGTVRAIKAAEEFRGSPLDAEVARISSKVKAEWERARAE